MRKVMLLAAMLAMVLAAAAPVFAQDTDIDGDENVVTNEGADTQYNAVCQNIIGSFGDITQQQSGNADAVATDDSEAVAEVAQEQGVTVNQVNQCLNDFDEDDNGVIEVDEDILTVSATAEAEEGSASAAAEEGSASASASASATAAAAEVLPETGGASLLALGAGALLVAGGLVARRIVR